MAYTEIIQRNDNTYYYRTISLRVDNKVSKKRKYLGKNLTKNQLQSKEKTADKDLGKIQEYNSIKRKLRKILSQENIKKASIFGSYSRLEQKKSSDVDLIIQPPKNMGFEYFSLEDKISKKLNKKVDIITYNSINPLLKEQILKDEERII